MKNKKSFFERLTGNINVDDELDESEDDNNNDSENEKEITKEQNWVGEDECGQLTIDMYQTPSEITIKAMVAGVKPEDLDVDIGQDMITLKGSRQKSKEVDEENYYYKELYWGGFSRSIMLPQEVDADEAKASIGNGVLVIKLPKVNREKTKKVKIEID